MVSHLRYSSALSGQPRFLDAPSSPSCYTVLVEALAEQLGLVSDDIAPDDDLGADLGIDTLELAIVLAKVQATLGRKAEPTLRLAQYHTVGALAQYLTRVDSAPEPATDLSPKPCDQARWIPRSLTSHTANETHTISDQLALRERWPLLSSVPWVGAHGLVVYGRGDQPEALARQAVALLGTLRTGCDATPTQWQEASIPPHASERLVLRVLAHEDGYDIAFHRLNGTLVGWIAGYQLNLGAPCERPCLSPVLIRSRRLRGTEAQERAEHHGMHHYLTAQELSTWRRLRRPLRRKEWLAARIVAKELTQEWLRDLHGVSPPLNAIMVGRDNNGAPTLTLRDDWSARLDRRELPSLSMSHSGGVAMAALAPCNIRGIGVDLEALGTQDPAFVAAWFDDAERALHIPGAPNPTASVTALWTIKEALSKTLGLGLKLALGELKVTHVDTNGRATVRLQGHAAQRWQELGGGALSVQVRLEPGFACAEVLMKAPQRSPQQRQRLAAIAALLREKGLLVSTQRV